MLQVNGKRQGLSAFVRRLARDQRGVTALEYGVLASLFVLATIQALDSLGGAVEESFDGSSDAVASARDGNESANGSSGGSGNTGSPVDSEDNSTNNNTGDDGSTDGGDGGATEPPPAASDIVQPDEEIVTSIPVEPPPVAAMKVDP